MAVIELIFPRFKTDPASLEEIERDWPVISKILLDPNPGLLHAYRGWILTEDGQDVREAYKEFLLFEWNKADSFHAFLGSEQFAAFAGSIRHLVTGPSTLQLFETNCSPREMASAPVVEIIRVGIFNSENIEASLQTWGKISHSLSGKASVTYGKCLNLERDIVMGIIGWPSLKDRSELSREGDFMEALDSFKLLGKVSHITVDIDPIELGTL
ncbi:hypothetical protein BDV23DRAFT_160022 [Aspergillus alliaceus]|uniref:ABM domain-containing protein n=1 Tax=Petromyces alliaceus TaxID=209559 RepID=A0A5N7C1I2_PETAA|nr:hypothetical protein BDV23DRAFT_160022 [Aspergillus alliaceus]